MSRQTVGTGSAMPALSREVYIYIYIYMGVPLNYCSQNGGNLYRARYYNRNLIIGHRIDSNLKQSPYIYIYILYIRPFGALAYRLREGFPVPEAKRV